MDRPLVGRRVLVMRAAGQASKLSDGLRALGAEPVEVPVLEIRPPENTEPLDQALRQLASYDWLIFTSTNTVRALADRAVTVGVDLKAIQGKIAAVGEATASTLGKNGLHVHYVPENYVAESVVEGFPEDVSGKRILLARAAVARDVIPNALRAAGALIDVVDAYRNVLPENAPELLQKALLRWFDAAAFTSSSTVTHLAEAAAKAGVEFPLPNVPAISIGPITSITLREHRWEPAAEADPHDISGLLAATAQILSR